MIQCLDGLTVNSWCNQTRSRYICFPPKCLVTSQSSCSCYYWFLVDKNMYFGNKDQKVSGYVQEIPQSHIGSLVILLVTLYEE